MKVSILARSCILVLIMYSVSPAYAMPSILVMGDSLSDAYKMDKANGWVNLLADKLYDENYQYQVINGSVSGATTADALKVFPRLLATYQPAITIIALGSNDGLRGNPVINMRVNLAKMIKDALDAESKVLLIGFKLPPNYGEMYRKEFEKIFPDLSYEYDVPLVPFLLEGVALDLKYFQADKIHPNEATQPLILNNVWPYLKPLL